MSPNCAGIARRVCLPALLVLATGLIAQPPSSEPTQSLGDVARQQRAERQHGGSSSRKVYTNEDLRPSTADVQAKATEGDEQPSQAEPESAVKSADAGVSEKDEAAKKEAELQKRTQEINQQYTDKILDIRAKIATAKKELEKAQHDQSESTNQFRTTNGTSPSIYEYQEQQRGFQQEIETQKTQIASLSAQLEDAQEAARHAGVRIGD